MKLYQKNLISSLPGTIGMLFVGISGYLQEYGHMTLAVIILCAGILSMIATFLFKRMKHIDIWSEWDDSARESYANSRRLAINLTVFVLFIAVIFFILFDFSYCIHSYDLALTVFVFSLLPDVLFIYYEKQADKE